jgi:hypothetical protein
MSVATLLREDVLDHFVTLMRNVSRTCRPDDSRATRWLYDELAYPSEQTRATIDALALAAYDDDGAPLLAPGVNRAVEDTVISLGDALERPVALTYVATTVGALFLHPLLPVGDISWPQVMLVIRRLAQHVPAHGENTAHESHGQNVASPVVRRHDDDVEEFLALFRRSDDVLYSLDPATRYAAMNDFVARWHHVDSRPVHAALVNAVQTCRANPELRRTVRRDILESRAALLQSLQRASDPRAPYAAVLWTLVRCFAVGSSLLQCCSRAMSNDEWSPAAAIAGHLLSSDN